MGDVPRLRLRRSLTRAIRSGHPWVYRDAIDGQRALEILRAHPGRYDPACVQALADAMETPEGEKMLLTAKLAQNAPPQQATTAAWGTA